MFPGVNGFRTSLFCTALPRRDLTFKGDLDEVSIWKKALPVAEIWKKASFLLQPH
jgi:hypothetical protein